jgi:hypothetical protein
MGTGKAGSGPARAVVASVAIREGARTMSALPRLATHIGVVAERFLGKPKRPRLIVDNAPIWGVEAELARARDAYDRARIARDQAKHVNDEVERSLIEALSGIARIVARARSLSPCAVDRLIKRSAG